MTDKKTTTSQTRSFPRKYRVLLVSLAFLLVLFIALGVILRTAVTTESGSQQLWKTITWFMPGTLSGELTEGTFATGVTLYNLHYKDATTEVAIDKIQSQWSWSLTGRWLHVHALAADDIDVRLKPDNSPDTPLALPDSMALPLSLQLDGISFKQLRVTQEGSDAPYVLHNLMLAARSDRQHHTITLEQLHTPFGKVSGSASLNGIKPFALKGKVDIHGQYQDRQYQIGTTVSGSLEKLDLDIAASGADANGTVQARLTPFFPIPFEHATINISNLSPRIFTPEAPDARLSIASDIQPLHSTDERKQAAPTSVSGDIRIVNSNPGTIDSDRIPLSSVSASMTIDMHKQTLSDLDIRLMKDTRLTGEGTFKQDSQRTLTGALTLDTVMLDLHEIHSKMQPSALKGPLTINITPQAKTISMQLKDQRTQVNLNSIITPDEIVLKSLELKAYDARLHLKGSVRTDDTMSHTLSAELKNFDPGIWMHSTPQGKTDINMTMQLSGSVHPTLRSELNFSISNNSLYAGLPLQGKGKLHMDGMRLLPSQVMLNIAGNSLNARGSFGNAGDSIRLQINAPELSRIGHGLDGTLQLDGNLSGSMAAPKLAAKFNAGKLRVPGLDVTTMEGTTDISIPKDTGDIATARMNLAVRVTGLSTDTLKLASVDANLQGTGASHKLSIQASGDTQSQQLRLLVAAHGKLIAAHDRYGWQGTIDQLENTPDTSQSNALPSFRLEAPVPLTASVGNIDVGALRMVFAQTRIDIPFFRYKDGDLRTKGNIKGLDVAGLQQIIESLTPTRIPLQSDLVLDTDWDIAFGQQATGYMQLQRTSGDLYIRNSAKTTMALGMNKLAWRATLSHNAINLKSEIQSGKIGTFRHDSTIGLVREKGMFTISPASSLKADVMLDMPALNKSGELIGPQVRLSGSFGMRLQVTGTVESPLVSGKAQGDKINFILLDQGAQLQNGTVRIQLDRNIMELQKFAFSGGAGTLNANGKVNLGNAGSDLRANVIADRLQIFAAPDRQLQLSGNATLGNVGGQMRLDGDIHVLRALFDTPKSSAPSLGDDVFVKGQYDDTDQKSAAPSSGSLIPAIHLRLDLGSNFRFRGSGADLLLSGDLEVTREPMSTLTSAGTIYATGTYETLGTKLNIERGLLNFKGPLSNPDLSITAMRRNQEVAAGVDITGSARQPRVKLISEPNVSDEEKLSWMMFGRSSNTSNVSETNATAKALSILGNFGGKKIAQGFGFDYFAIGQSESGLSAEQVVNIGKYITHKIMFGVEKSLTGPDNIAKLTWNISRRWEVVIRGGTINGINVLFNVRYD